MPKLRKFLVTFAATVLLAPSVALASGPSAGDQTYCDPLSGCNSPASHHSAPATNTSNSTGSGSGSGSSSGTTSVTASGPATSDPSASVTSGSTSATSSSVAKTLPHTGMDIGLVALIGVGMLGGGLVVRRRALRS